MGCLPTLRLPPSPLTLPPPPRELYYVPRNQRAASFSKVAQARKRWSRELEPRLPTPRPMSSLEHLAPSGGTLPNAEGRRRLPGSDKHPEKQKLRSEQPRKMGRGNQERCFSRGNSLGEAPREKSAQGPWRPGPWMLTDPQPRPRNS